MLKNVLSLSIVAALAFCFVATTVNAEEAQAAEEQQKLTILPPEGDMPSPCCDVKPCCQCDPCCCKIVCKIVDYKVRQRGNRCIVTYKKVIKKVCVCDCCDPCCKCKCAKVLKVERVRKVCKLVCKPTPCCKPCPAPCSPCC